eukprot:8366291-Pyramimonas_sp.AAC.1
MRSFGRTLLCACKVYTPLVTVTSSNAALAPGTLSPPSTSLWSGVGGVGGCAAEGVWNFAYGANMAKA